MSEDPLPWRKMFHCPEMPGIYQGELTAATYLIVKYAENLTSDEAMGVHSMSAFGHRLIILHICSNQNSRCVRHQLEYKMAID